MRSLFWTEQAREDLTAIRSFITQTSPVYAEIVVAKLIAATERINRFPESGRSVPEFSNPSVREVIMPPYRIVYRLVGNDSVHILTVHHGARNFPAEL